jgi:hypothetical protein
MKYIVQTVSYVSGIVGGLSALFASGSISPLCLIIIVSILVIGSLIGVFLWRANLILEQLQPVIRALAERISPAPGQQRNISTKPKRNSVEGKNTS